MLHATQIMLMAVQKQALCTHDLIGAQGEHTLTFSCDRAKNGTPDPRQLYFRILLDY
jgi:hypothetical protein